VREAALLALSQDIGATSVDRQHILEALDKVKPRTDLTRLKFYDQFENGVVF